VVPAGAPPGRYLPFIALTPPNALGDARIDALDVFGPVAAFDVVP